MEAIRPIGSEDKAVELRSQALQELAKGTAPAGKVVGQALSATASSKAATDETEIPNAIDAADLEAMVGKLGDYAQAFERSLRFSVDEESGRTLIKVVDAQTDELIRQIPSEEALRILRHIAAGSDGEKRGSQGFFVTERA